MQTLSHKLLACFMICAFTIACVAHVEARGNAVSFKDYTYLYQLTKSSVASLSRAKVVVADPDYGASNSPLDATKIAQLKAGGTMVILYKSIGEASDYRDYWKKYNFDATHPAFVLEANKDWHGDFKVKFWDPAWQNIVLEDIESIARRGADGIYLDIVDGYAHETVIGAYAIDQANGLVPANKTVRDAMEDFVIAISQRAKAINPAIHIIPQNAVNLLTIEGNGVQPNMRYMNAIDAIGVEDTWFRNNERVSWTEWNLANLRHVVAARKYVLATDYPTEQALQQEFVENALAQKFIPFVGKRALANEVLEINRTIPARIAR